MGQKRIRAGQRSGQEVVAPISIPSMPNYRFMEHNLLYSNGPSNEGSRLRQLADIAAMRPRLQVEEQEQHYEQVGYDTVDNVDGNVLSKQKADDERKDTDDDCTGKTGKADLPKEE